jgi:hypothetical protein
VPAEMGDGSASGAARDTADVICTDGEDGRR